MFTKSENSSKIETVIGPSVSIDGGFVSQGDVKIEGSVTGSIVTNGNLLVGEQAHITANIQASNAYIAGHIKGNLQVKERLELAPTSKIDGDISTKVLIVAEGAQVSGKFNMGSLSSQALANDRNSHKKPVANAAV
ncbi:MAG: polymer-forming cytoskeletal protein [Patescibacteria group bacterium]